jgi:hypothetical protein
VFISAEMNLVELIGLMGETTSLSNGTVRADLTQAEELRDLLVRDFGGQDTAQIADGTWHAYCCAVAPSEQMTEQP